MAKIAPYAKAITAALVAFLSALGSGLSDGSLSGGEWIASGIAFLVASLAVWRIPNKKLDGE